MYKLRGTGVSYLDVLSVAGRGLQEAILISQDCKYVGLPLVTLAASSSVVKAAAEGYCSCEEVCISLPGFPHRTLEQLADFVSGRDIAATNGDLIQLSELCTVLGISHNILFPEIPKREPDIQDEMYGFATDHGRFYEDGARAETVRPSDWTAASTSGIAHRATIMTNEMEITILPVRKHHDDPSAHDDELKCERILPDDYIKDEPDEEYDGRRDMMEPSKLHNGLALLNCEAVMTRETDNSMNNSDAGENMCTAQQEMHAAAVPQVGNRVSAQCEICGKVLGCKTTVKRHIQRVHAGEKPFMCEICAKVLGCRTALDRHKLIHTGEKPYLCEVCKKQFRSGSALYRHMLIHNGLMPHTCEVCQRPFREKSALNKHMLIHQGIYPFPCKLCDQAFREKSNLNRHMMIHLGIKPYKCFICGKGYRETSELRKHMFIQHNRSGETSSGGKEALSDHVTEQQ